MREYEIATILNTELDEASQVALTESIEGWIADSGGDIARVDNWGRRKLAYPIRRKYEGHYVFWYANLPPTAPAGLERQMRLSEDVIRFMITRSELIVPSEEDVENVESVEGASDDESVVSVSEEPATSTDDVPETVDSRMSSADSDLGESESVV